MLDGSFIYFFFCLVCVEWLFCWYGSTHIIIRTERWWRVGFFSLRLFSSKIARTPSLLVCVCCSILLLFLFKEKYKRKKINFNQLCFVSYQSFSFFCCCWFFCSFDWNMILLTIPLSLYNPHPLVILFASHPFRFRLLFVVVKKKATETEWYGKMEEYIQGHEVKVETLENLIQFHNFFLS